MMQNNTLDQAYQQCMLLARSHYENFPVASRLLPACLQRATAVIYAFARRGDDIADEGNMDCETRLAGLQNMWSALDDIAAQRPAGEFLFMALADVIQTHDIPLQYFYDLLSAFRSDITTSQYDSFAAIQAYCRQSADPVGRIVLHLHHQAEPQNLTLSDSICTALQLLNFIQDLDSDWQHRQRCYLPLDEMRTHGISLDDLTSRRDDPQIHRFIQLQIHRVRQMLVAGAPLVQRLHGRLAWVIRAIVASAWQVSNKLASRKSIYQRPTLRPADIPVIIFYMLFYTKYICIKTPIKSSA